MASLQDAQQLTKSLEELVGQLRSELENGKVDFEKLVSLSDEISERADGMAETFSTVNETLMERLQKIGSGGTRKSARKETAKSASGGGNG
jgi:predicted transcriptional regulator